MTTTIIRSGGNTFQVSVKHGKLQPIYQIFQPPKAENSNPNVKQCSQCGEYFSLSKFYERKDSGLLYAQCKACRRILPKTTPPWNRRLLDDRQK